MGLRLLAGVARAAPHRGGPVLERQRLVSVEIETGEPLPAEGIGEHRRDRAAVAVAHQPGEHAHRHPGRHGVLDRLDDRIAAIVDELHDRQVEACLDVAHILRSEPAKDLRRRLVVATGRGEPRRQQADDQVVEVGEAAEAILRRPRRRRLREADRIEPLQQPVRQRTLEMQVGLRFRESPHKLVEVAGAGGGFVHGGIARALRRRRNLADARPPLYPRPRGALWAWSTGATFFATRYLLSRPTSSCWACPGQDPLAGLVNPQSKHHIIMAKKSPKSAPKKKTAAKKAAPKAKKAAKKK